MLMSQSEVLTLKHHVWDDFARYDNEGYEIIALISSDAPSILRGRHMISGSIEYSNFSPRDQRDGGHVLYSATLRE